MNNDKDNGQQQNQEKSNQLEPIEPQIVTNGSEIQAGFAVEEFMDNYPTLMGQALLLMLQQDAQNLRLAINQTQALFKKAKEATQDGITIIMMQYMTDMIRLFDPMQRSMGFMIEGRFETASKEFKKAKESCYSNVEQLKAIDGPEDPEKNEILETLSVMFRIFSGMMYGYECHCSAEIIGYQGRTKEYAVMLRETVGVLRDAAALAPPGCLPAIAQISYICSKIADQLEVRAEVFDKIAAAQRFIETTGQNVFIIHGHDEAKWRELRDLLEDEFNLKTVVIKEMAGVGRTIIDKFEHYAMDSCFSFAILTPDDFVDKGHIKYLQARPNVLFEMGWFYGRYGPPRLCILKKTGTELPSDLDGISTIEFDENIIEQSLSIRKELRQAGLVD